MSVVDQNDLALLALTTRAIPGGIRPLSSREVWVIRGMQRAGRLLGADVTTVANVTGTGSEVALRIARLLERASRLAVLVEQWEHEGVWTLTMASVNYPTRLRDRLGNNAPVVLHGVGAVELLCRDGLGVVGSRNLSAEGIEVARRTGQWAASRGITLVTGGARGADREAGMGCMDQGGESVWVLADSLRKGMKERALRPRIIENRLGLCTPYHPDAPFAARLAMGRNKIIYGLSLRALIVASDLSKGGTWAGAVEAIRNDTTDVRVWRGPGEGPGNIELQRRGAMSVSATHELADRRPTAESGERPVPTHVGLGNSGNEGQGVQLALPI